MGNNNLNKKGLKVGYWVEDVAQGKEKGNYNKFGERWGIWNTYDLERKYLHSTHYKDGQIVKEKYRMEIKEKIRTPITEEEQRLFDYYEREFVRMKDEWYSSRESQE